MNLAEEGFKNFESPSTQSRLKAAVTVTSLVFLLEAVGGWLAGSLALMSDAVHMFMDVFALTLSWLAIKTSSRLSTDTKTFGFHRLEIFAALINGLLLLGVGTGIIIESYRRYHNPPPINPALLSGVAVVGLAANLLVMYLLKSDLKHSRDLNLQSAFFHVLGDSLASLAVIVGGLIIIFTGWRSADALAAIGVGILIIISAWSFISDSTHILLEGVPKGISLKDVEQALTSIPAIKNIHELHIWCICSNIYALSTHALLNAPMERTSESLLSEIENLLRDKFNITHSTIQLETHPCPKTGILCSIKH